MTQEYSDLTGQWTGRFDYDHAGQPAPFEVDLTETAGALTGHIREPNSFRDDMGSELAANLEGARVDDQVSFVKSYRGFDQGRDLIYDGQVNPNLTRIEGRWYFSGEPGWGGRFSMARKPLARAKASSQAAIESTV